MPVAEGEGIGIAELAQVFGVAEPVIRRGIKSGRLEKSIRRNAAGHLRVTNLALAREEWEANVNPKLSLQHPYLTTADERRRLIRAQRAKVGLQVAQMRGSMISAVEAEQVRAARVVEARTKLLGLVSRAKQRLPHLGETDLAVIDGLIREALEELADASPAETNGHG